jgi:hypothetical protein
MPWKPLEGDEFPSLGYGIAEWIEAFCCHGPGDVQGEPIQFDREELQLLVNLYRIDPETGRRVYDEGVYSRPKGRAKSEKAGLIGVAEAFGRCASTAGTPTGSRLAKPVTSPLLKCLATEESQAGNTFENIAFIAAEWGPDVHPEIYGGVKGARQYQSATALYLPHGGEIRASTAGSASKDGGKETFVVADETHLYVLRELKAMYGTVRRNLGKRKIAQPWLLQTTTAYRPGEQSIAEETLTAWRKGELSPAVHVDHREAKGRVDLDDEAHTLAAAPARLRRGRRVDGPRPDLPGDARPAFMPGRGDRSPVLPEPSMSTKDAWIAKDVVERQSARATWSLPASRSRWASTVR